MRKIINILFLINTITCFSQTNDFFRYYSLINQAEIANIKKDFVKSDSLYYVAFTLVNNRGYAYDYFMATKNAIQNKSDYLKYIEQGFENGLLYKIIKADTIYNYLKREKLIKKLKNKYKKIRSKYLSTLNSTLRDEIAEMVKEDQKYRKGRYSVMGWQKQKTFLNKVDNRNYNKILYICKNYGFPGRNLVGDDGNEIGFVDVPLLLRHMDSIQLISLKPYILESIKKGNFHPSHFAFAYDYVTMFKTTVDDLDDEGNNILIIQQKLGIVTRFENGKKFLFPVESIKKANELRAKIGLESLEDYALKIKCKMPDEGFYKRTFKKNK